MTEYPHQRIADLIDAAEPIGLDDEDGSGEGDPPAADGGGEGPPQPRAFGFDVPKMNREWALVLMGSKAVIVHEQATGPIEDRVRVLTLDAFRAWFLNTRTEYVGADGKIKAVTWATAWLQSRKRRQYRGIEFKPDPDLVDGAEGYLNLWRGFAVQPRRKVNGYAVLKDHILNNCCGGNAELFAWVFGWFAHIVQRPRERVGTALVMRGKMGTGKTKIGEAIGSLFPSHYFLVDDEFEGYGAIFGNVDLHGDRILPGAFAATLAERKAAGGSLPMHVNHGLPQLGGQRAVGVWPEVAEDTKGLRVKGKISGMNTDAGRNLYERVKDGAFPGLSIGYRVAQGGASYGTKAGEARRTLKMVHLGEISLVDTPSNGAALIDAVKTALATPDHTAAAAAIAQAMRLHDKHMGSESYGYGGAALRERAQIMNHLRDGFEALTGSRAPEDLTAWKAAPSIRDVEAMLREEFDLSHAQARALAERRFKAAPRDEGSEAKSTAAISEILSGFRLPKL